MFYYSLLYYVAEDRSFSVNVAQVSQNVGHPWARVRKWPHFVFPEIGHVEKFVVFSKDSKHFQPLPVFSLPIYFTAFWRRSTEHLKQQQK